MFTTNIAPGTRVIVDDDGNVGVRLNQRPPTIDRRTHGNGYHVANAGAADELTILATALATNSQFTAADLKQLGLPRLRELASGALKPGAGQPRTTPRLQRYDINSVLDEDWNGYDLNNPQAKPAAAKPSGRSSMRNGADGYDINDL